MMRVMKAATKSSPSQNTLFGYGFTDAISGYVSLPYAKKELIDDETSQGFGDINLIVQYGFKYGSRDGYKGWYSFNADDTAGADYTLPEWKFGLSFSMTLPSGKIHSRDRNSDPLGVGSQTGFAVPSYNFTAIASKMLAPHGPGTAMSSSVRFLQWRSGGGKPGNETRINNSTCTSCWKIRVDSCLASI